MSEELDEIQEEESYRVWDDDSVEESFGIDTDEYYEDDQS